MREIKFRIHDCSFARGKWLYFSLEQLFHLRPAIREELKWVGQYTGFKDKNDKEIYESDILMQQSTILCEDKLHTISVFVYECVWHEGAFKLQDADGDLIDLAELLFGIEAYEIIGNIHENSELLNEK